MLMSRLSAESVESDDWNAARRGWSRYQESKSQDDLETGRLIFIGTQRRACESGDLSRGGL